VTTPGITLSGTASDSGAGNSGITSVMVNGGAAAGGTATGSATANWSRALTLAAGANTITVTGTDGAGNARQVQLSITYAPPDTTAPTLSVTSHTPGQTVTTASITLSGTASDSGAGNGGIAGVTVNGAAATGGTATGSGTASWSRALTLAAGANDITVVARDGAGNTRSVALTITLSVLPSVSADSVSPSSGSGASGRLVLRYTNSRGAADFASVRVRIGTSSATDAGNCTVSYLPASGTLSMLGDAGSGWMSAPLGTGALENSQCAVDLAETSASASGSTMTLDVAVSFKPAFAGAKNVYMFGESTTGVNTGWQQRGTWQVPSGGPLTLAAIGVTPSVGSGTSESFVLQYSDSLGASDLVSVRVRFGTTYSANANNCTVAYDASTGAVSILNDAGTTWQAATFGSGVLQNSQCAIDLAGSSASLNGTTVTMALAVGFKPAFAGAKNTYMLAVSSTGANTGWEQRGTWTVPQPQAPANSSLLGYWSFNEGGGTSASDDAGDTAPGALIGGAGWTTGRFGAAVSLDGVNDYVALPNVNVSGSAMTIAAWVRTSSFGTTDQRFVSKAVDGTINGQYWTVGAYVTGQGQRRLRFWLRTGGSTSTLSASSGDVPVGTWYHVAAVYDGATMRLFLNGTQVGQVVKSGTIAANSAAAVNVGRSHNGGGFANGAIDDVRIYDRALTGDELAQVIGGLSEELLSAAAASGSAGTLTVQHHDSIGTNNLAATRVRIGTASTAGTGDCTISYSPASGTVSLLNDAGSAWFVGAMGTGSLQNSQCTIDLASSRVRTGHATVTLDFAIAFKPAFAGSKNIYLLTERVGGTNTGWQAHGSWEVP
jgi:hypothetical protein